MPTTREFLNGLKRFGSRAHFPCPKCGGRAVRALSDTHGQADQGDFYCLDHKEPFTAPLMQSDKGGILNKDQEIIVLEIEKQLREKQNSGGGCIYLSLGEWGERLEMSEGDFLRQFAELVDAGKVRPSVIEICG
jgi:hypothetical protein